MLGPRVLDPSATRYRSTPMSEKPAPRDSLLPQLVESAARVTRVDHPPVFPVKDRVRARLPDLPDLYVDEGHLGSGGMGEVRAVRDVALRRRVAMKILSASAARAPATAQMFVEEARTVGQLEHPSIPPVYEMGADADGVAYFTMKIVEGETLWSLLRAPERPPGSPERLREGVEILTKVCDALGFAHSRGVIHRDLKSSNIMVGEFGEVFLMDWGLAKILRGRAKIDVPRADDSPLAQRIEGTVGTTAYMAPEQAAGGLSTIDERTDVFGLGAVLYEILTGQYPYTGATDEEVLARARACDFTPPEAVSPDVFVPRQIARVAMKAMAREPSSRYASVSELKLDLQRFLHGGLYLPRVTFAPGERIVTEGDPSDAAYIITQGECEVFKTLDGERRILRRMGSRSVFGEAAVMSNLPRTATVEAITPVTVLKLSRDVLDAGLGSDGWERLLVKSLVERFRELEARVAEMEKAASAK